jgi:hypothetical protein
LNQILFWVKSLPIGIDLSCQEIGNQFLEYQKGKIGFKLLCKLSDLSFHQGSLLLESRNIEPPISEIMDLYTKKVRETLTAKDLFKDGKIPKRKSQEVNLDTETEL